MMTATNDTSRPIPSTTDAMLRSCGNIFGPLKADTKVRIRRFLKSPTPKNWNAVYSIILRDGRGFGMGLSFWQAWIAVDPTAPRSKPCDRPWSAVPDRFTAYRALQHAATRAENSTMNKGEN